MAENRWWFGGQTETPLFSWGVARHDPPWLSSFDLGGKQWAASQERNRGFQVRQIQRAEASHSFIVRTSFSPTHTFMISYPHLCLSFPFLFFRWTVIQPITDICPTHRSQTLVQTRQTRNSPVFANVLQSDFNVLCSQGRLYFAKIKAAQVLLFKGEKKWLDFVKRV